MINSWHFCNYFVTFLHSVISQVQHIFSNVKVFLSAHDYSGEIILGKPEVHASKNVKKSLLENSTILQREKCTRITLSVGMRQSSDNLIRQSLPASDNSNRQPNLRQSFSPTSLIVLVLRVVQGGLVLFESHVSHKEVCDVTRYTG